MPKPGVFSAPDSAVETGALTVYSWAVAPSRRASQASLMSMRPEPCSYAWKPLICFAVLVSAVRRSAGASFMRFCLAAEISSAEAPAACGEAIEVPCSMP